MIIYRDLSRLAGWGAALGGLQWPALVLYLLFGQRILVWVALVLAMAVPVVMTRVRSDLAGIGKMVESAPKDSPCTSEEIQLARTLRGWSARLESNVPALSADERLMLQSCTNELRHRLDADHRPGLRAVLLGQVE